MLLWDKDVVVIYNILSAIVNVHMPFLGVYNNSPAHIKFVLLKATDLPSCQSLPVHWGDNSDVKRAITTQSLPPSSWNQVKPKDKNVV